MDRTRLIKKLAANLGYPNLANDLTGNKEEWERLLGDARAYADLATGPVSSETPTEAPDAAATIAEARPRGQKKLTPVEVKDKKAKLQSDGSPPLGSMNSSEWATWIEHEKRSMHRSRRPEEDGEGRK